jgi:hypothetical protein
MAHESRIKTILSLSRKLTPDVFRSSLYTSCALSLSLSLSLSLPLLFCDSRKCTEEKEIEKQRATISASAIAQWTRAARRVNASRCEKSTCCSTESGWRHRRLRPTDRTYFSLVLFIGCFPSIGLPFARWFILRERHWADSAMASMVSLREAREGKVRERKN